MRLPADLAAYTTKYLRTHFESALTQPDALSIEWPLHAPSASTAAANLEATRTFINAWYAWPAADEVEFAPRRWTAVGLGTHEVPVRIRLNGARRIAEVAGLAAALDHATVTAAAITEIFPGDSAFDAAVRHAHKQWADVSEYDLFCLARVLPWILANPSSGLWERAVPVEGVDGKWIGGHKRLLLTLLAPFGITELGLKSSDDRIRLRVLTPATTFAPVSADGAASVVPSWLRDIAVPIDAARSLFTPSPNLRVIIVENKQTFLAIPSSLFPNDVPAVALFGSGYAVNHVKELPWLEKANITYWGDLDADGFAILSRLRTQLPQAEVASLFMDPATVAAYEHLGVPDPSGAQTASGGLTRLTGLTDTERHALTALRDCAFAHNCTALRIEQERIPMSAVMEVRL